MKQAVLVDHNRMELREVPDPVPGPGDVLVQVKRSGICGSDLHTYKGEFPLLQPPLVMGHEFSGIVVDVGEGVEERRVGERVAVFPIVQCGACSFCQENKPALFERRNRCRLFCGEVVIDQRHILPDQIAQSHRHRVQREVRAGLPLGPAQVTHQNQPAVALQDVTNGR